MKTLFLAALFAFAATASAQTVDRVQLERRIAAVETLIERSSAAKQIEAGGNAAARAHRERAREIHRKAADACRSGDLEGASRLLPQASLAMFEGVRLSGAETVVADKRRADYDARLESARSLAAAQRRIALEKKGVSGAAETSRTIDTLIAQAEREAGAGDLETARGTLERAYLVAKASIGSMRGGDTLVRSLDFATKEEEYRYEVDRNDTHRMLLMLLVSDPAKAASAQAASGKAKSLRDEAERRAGAGAHAEAVGLLEESTKELVRAIRAAGIYIPG
ncbi:MAG: hypothetical protein IPL06_20170 [Betaproteobacteria bacterium]|nr:hypothetical protein [Betaproteobacteria bacterium]